MSRYIYLYLICCSVSLFAGSDRVLPHFTNKSGEWNTSLSLVNTNSTKVHLQIQAYSESGEMLANGDLNLDAYDQRNTPIETLFPALANTTGWLLIQADKSGLEALMIFRNLVNSGTSSLPLGDTGHFLNLPLLENQGSTVSGFVVTNPQASPVRLDLYLQNLENNAISYAQLELGAQAKLKGVLSDIFAEPIPARSSLRISASAPISGFALTFHNNPAQIVAVPGSLTDQGVLPELRSRTQAIYERYSDVGMSTGIQFADSDPVVATAGHADLTTGELLLPQHSSDIGSITKTFMATLFLMYQQDKLLDLDDKLAQWMPDFPRAEEISLRMLLNHTSGIVNYTEIDNLVEAVIDSYGNPQPIAPQQLIDFALASNGGFNFEPGTDWAYSNTNYIVLGLVAEAVGQQPIASQLRSRIIEPLRLTHTFLAGDEPAPGRAQTYLFLEGETYEISSGIDYSWLWTAGAMVSTNEDLMTFARALFHGHLLSDASLEEMTIPSGPPSNVIYGLGLAVLPLEDDILYGHSGGTFGGTAFMGWLKHRETAFTNTINSLTGDTEDTQDLTNTTLELVVGHPLEKRAGRNLVQRLHQLIGE